jgi:hypothetical protein
MNWISFFGKARKVIGKITDILIRGREAGLWTEKPGVGTINQGKPHDPSFPNVRFAVMAPEKRPIKATRVAWLVAIIGLLVYEGWTLLNSTPNDTLSEAVWEAAYTYPLLPFAAGVLIGHFFWQRRGNGPR